jgi:hypothetical protein
MTKHSTELSLPRLLIRSALRLGFGILLLATTLFLSFGSLDRPLAWVDRVPYRLLPGVW